MKRKDEEEFLSKGWLDRELDRIVAERGEYLRSRWYVNEVTPPEMYEQGDGHGGSETYWSGRIETRVSDYFATPAYAQEFIGEHDPDEGNYFEIKEERLYRRVVEQWY